MRPSKCTYIGGNNRVWITHTGPGQDRGPVTYCQLKLEYSLEGSPHCQHSELNGDIEVCVVGGCAESGRTQSIIETILTYFILARALMTRKVLENTHTEIYNYKGDEDQGARENGDQNSFFSRSLFKSTWAQIWSVKISPEVPFCSPFILRGNENNVSSFKSLIINKPSGARSDPSQ